MSFTIAAIDNLKQALAIAEQIQKLEGDLKSILGGEAVPVAPKNKSVSPIKKTGKRTMSPETIAKMKASQQARWAKKSDPSSVLAPAEAKAAPTPKKKKGITPEGRAKLAAAMKARWAARKKGAAPLNAPAKATVTSKPAKKGKISAEHKGKLAAAAKARWARIKAGKEKSPFKK